MGLRGYKPDTERQDRISELRASGMTLREIGESFDPPLSWQWVQQILQAVERDRERACKKDGDGV